MAVWLAVAMATCTLVPSFGRPALAAPSAIVRSDNVTAELTAEAIQAAPGETVAVLLHQRIRAGWHTYWRNPGDSGQETAIEWTLPDRAQASPIQWPAPSRIDYGDLVNYGYSDEVGLLSEITVPADWPQGRDFPVRALATWLVCEKICIPEEGAFELSIAVGEGTIANPPAAERFAAVRRTLPVASPLPAAYRADGDRVTLELTAPDLDGRRLTDVYFFPYQWGAIVHAAPQQVAHDGDTLRVTMVRGDVGVDGNLAGVLSLREDLDGGAARLALAVDAPPAAAMPAGTGTTMALPLVLLLAFAGGMLLNLMPCVFPVLAIKALGLAKAADAAPAARLAGGLAYTVGVLASFALLGVVLLALKAGGNAVGWGFHLQDPVVVAILAYVLFAVGLNLAGVFEIAGAWTGLGQGLAGRTGPVGSFFTGVLAAVVAAPCTAPFMATAVGFAFTQTAAIAMAALLALGAGLAAPYLLLTAVPGAARLLPRPGPWLGRFRQVLAFPMFASAAWLVWVLAQQADADAVGLVLLGMIALAFAAWLSGLGPASGGWRAANRVLAAIAAAVAIWFAATLTPATAPAVLRAATAAAEPFSPARLDALRAAGRPVLVNFTAAWCITCKVNEKVALSSVAFETALQQTGTAYLVGDWTRRDTEITAMLRRYDRAGVPLYLLFPADGGPAQVLPQLLTAQLVVDALHAAAAPRPTAARPVPETTTARHEGR